MTDRGQSNVVGVALLLGIAVISMGALTAAVGVVVDSTTAQADADRVSEDLDAALKPIEATGPNRGRVTFSRGRLYAVERTLEVRTDGRTVETVAVDAVVFESGDRRVAALLGALVRGRAGRAWLETRPPITADEDVLVVGAPTVGRDVGAVSGSGGVTATIATDVAHDRRSLGDATFTLALETSTPAAWERTFEDLGASVDRIPGDPATVEATFPGERTGYLVVHSLNTEVTADG
jgi:hypothetical protein